LNPKVGPRREVTAFGIYFNDEAIGGFDADTAGAAVNDIIAGGGA